MKALTIKQPWLYCITDLDKQVENRTWKPPVNIIGKRIALHASQTNDKNRTPYACELAGINLFDVVMPRGAIVATAVVLGWITKIGTSSLHDPKPYLKSKWFFGPIGWVLDDVQKIEPIYCNGRLGLWEVDPVVWIVADLYSLHSGKGE